MAIKITVLVIPAYFLFSIHLVQANTYASEEDFRSLEGQQVKFNYENYPEEREIAYKFYQQYYQEIQEEDEPIIINKADIGIFLYDIDHDEEKEILAYFNPKNSSYYCSNAGCPFNILKRKKDGDHKASKYEYEVIDWNAPEESITIDLLVHEVKILKTSTLGVQDLLFDNSSIWRWQGTHYKKTN